MWNAQKQMLVIMSVNSFIADATTVFCVAIHCLSEAGKTVDLYPTLGGDRV